MSELAQATDTDVPVLVRMRLEMPNLRPTERRLAVWFCEDPAKAVAQSVADLADYCQTSTASVIRFCRHFGFHRLEALREAVAADIARQTIQTLQADDAALDISEEDPPADVIAKVAAMEYQAISSTSATLDPEALAQAAELIVGAHRVEIFGSSASGAVARDLQRKLTRIGRVAQSWPDAHWAWTAAATLGPGQLAVPISYSGSHPDTLEFADIARETGASVLGLVGPLGDELASRADVVLRAGASQTSFPAGAFGTRIAQLMVVDCLFFAVTQRRYAESMKALVTSYAAVHSREYPRVAPRGRGRPVR